jgi:hypothetical protein
MSVSVMGESVFEVIGDPSIFKLTRKPPALTRVLPTSVFRVVENAARRKWNSPRLLKLQKSGQFPILFIMNQQSES